MGRSPKLLLVTPALQRRCGIVSLMAGKGWGGGCRDALEASLDSEPGQDFLVIPTRGLSLHCWDLHSVCLPCGCSPHSTPTPHPEAAPRAFAAPSPMITRRRRRAGQELPTSGFPVCRPCRPQAWISAEAGDPLGPDLCTLSLGRASCQGDDRIEFRVKGTNLVCLILSSLSSSCLPFLCSLSLSLFFIPFSS